VRVRTGSAVVVRPRRDAAQKSGRASVSQTVTRSVVTDDGDWLGWACIELARLLRARAAEIREIIFAHVRAVVPDAVADGDERLEAGLRGMIAACIECGLASIEQGARWSEPMPPVVLAHASRAASSGMSLANALRRCVASHTRGWSFVLEEAARLDLSDEQRLMLLARVSVAVDSLLERLQTQVADAHVREIKRRSCSREQRRMEIALRLLDRLVDPEELAELTYELDAWHLAVIATGADAEKTVRCLASSLGRELLPIAHGTACVCAWLGGQRKLAFADIERVFLALEYRDVSLAVGELGERLPGWRQTHREAQDAALVARYWPRRLTRYQGVALEAAALRDEVLADALIERCLAPLDDEHGGGVTRRRVLRAVFEAEYNKSSAAHALDVDPETVRRHVKEAEHRLGCPLHVRQAEIEIALRVEELRRRRDDCAPSPHPA
jgi:hypothetical protein